jgi:hypothetical protein
MPSVLPRRVRFCAVVITLLPLLPVLGCGGGGSNFGGSATGGFSVASFNGHYAIALTGANSEGVLRESGVLTPDGKGNITSGTMDVAQGGGVTSLIFDGTYKLNADGTGVATLNLPGGNIKLAMTLVSRSTIYAIEDDHFANVSGLLEQQDPAAFAAAPGGTFVFSLHGLQGPGSSAIVGTFTANKGTLAGDQDANLSGTLKTQAPLAGSFTAPDTTGRGTLRLSNAAGGTSSFFYYVVNTDSFRILSSDTSGLSGRAERQAAGPFGDASLAGGYAFGSTGDTTVVGASRAAGRFNADGAGTIRAGQSDAVVNGTVTTATGFSGSYAIDSAGRGTMNTLGVGAASSRILRLVSARRGRGRLDAATRRVLLECRPQGPVRARAGWFRPKRVGRSPGRAASQRPGQRDFQRHPEPRGQGQPASIPQRILCTQRRRSLRRQRRKPLSQPAALSCVQHASICAAGGRSD